MVVVKEQVHVILSVEPSHSSEAMKVTAYVTFCVSSKQSGRSQSTLTRPNSHTGSLPRACRGHSPPWAALMLECWMCGIAGGSVQPRPLGEDEHLIGMLATLGEAERGEIKRSLL